ncbi:MAG TPA: hypothetical protein VFY35_09490 [Burkholderiaceae bacterium]|nr:hypothetical protein [Burkholderiaceae bacterium]
MTTPTLPLEAPIHMVAPPHSATLMLMANTVLVLLALWGVLRHWRQTGSAVGFWLLLGGTLCTLNEPIVDVVGKVWFPTFGNTPLLTAWGVSIPIYMLPVYCWYVGGQAFLSYRMCQQGLTLPGLYRRYATFAGVNVLLEVPPIVLGMYSYYGHQPFVLLGFPVWWTFCNALMPMVMGGLVYRLEPLLHGWRQVLIVPLAWMVAAAVNGAVGAPTWLALNLTGTTPWLTHLAAVASLGLGLLTCYGLGLLVVARAR